MKTEASEHRHRKRWSHGALPPYHEAIERRGYSACNSSILLPLIVEKNVDEKLPVRPADILSAAVM
jgi:hypothetical protein